MRNLELEYERHTAEYRRLAAQMKNTHQKKQFLEQPPIFDRDHRLVSEGLGKCNLLIGKRLHDGALEKQNSNGHALALQRHAEQGSNVPRSRSIHELGIGVGLRVNEMN